MLLAIVQAFVATCRDVLPVLALIVGFQFIVLRQPIPHLRQVVVGFGFVLIGLTLFLVGLEKALFPLGKTMATQLSAPTFVFGTEMAPDNPPWRAYGWVYLFAALIGFATTIAEPALIASNPLFVAPGESDPSGRGRVVVGVAMDKLTRNSRDSNVREQGCQFADRLRVQLLPRIGQHNDFRGALRDQFVEAGRFTAAVKP